MTVNENSYYWLQGAKILRIVNEKWKGFVPLCIIPALAFHKTRVSARRFGKIP